MKVIYAGYDPIRLKNANENYPDSIILIADRWDGYSYRTTCIPQWRNSDSNIELSSIKILIEDVMDTHKHLASLFESGWDGHFPIPDSNYVSVPGSILFYEQIDGHLDLDSAINVAELLRDASYLVHIAGDENAIRLTKQGGFSASLQREKSLAKSYLDGWKILGKKSTAIDNQIFKFNTTDDIPSEIQFVFASGILPHDIHVLIGPNGVGKSRLLHEIVSYWIEENSDKISGFVNRPNFSGLIVISYSPFERFPVDLSDSENKIYDKDIYQYFGLRGRVEGEKGIQLLTRTARERAANSVVSSLQDDVDYGSIRSWSQKIMTIESVLSKAIKYDYLALSLMSDENPEKLFGNSYYNEKLCIELFNEEQQRRSKYALISSQIAGELSLPALKRSLDSKWGVDFVKDGAIVKLSSGQRLFAYIVMNIVGAIRRNSLILIDEPELFLHPTLEIIFIDMLKEILANYAARAIIATHSLIVVREVPSDCVHVFTRSKEGIYINTPPFETFGADVQRISSYVFGDKSVSKPYEAWLRKLLAEHSDPQDVISALGTNINEELIIQIQTIAQEKSQNGAA